jgi:hypothetical protein
MAQVLGIVTRAIANNLLMAAGMTCATAQTGEGLRFRGVSPLRAAALEKLMQGIEQLSESALDRRINVPGPRH